MSHPVGAPGVAEAKGSAGFEVESAWIVTVNVCVVGVFVPSLVVTVTVTVPVTPAGAVSSSTPF